MAGLASTSSSGQRDQPSQVRHGDLQPQDRKAQAQKPDPPSLQVEHNRDFPMVALGRMERVETETENEAHSDTHTQRESEMETEGGDGRTWARGQERGRRP